MSSESFVSAGLAQFWGLQTTGAEFVPLLENTSVFLIATLFAAYVVYYVVSTIAEAILCGKRPPTFNYLLPALMGKFDMKNHSVMKMVRYGYDKHGECYSLNVLNQRITFMIGHEAQSVMFQANDKQLSQQEVYKFTIPVFGKNIVYDAPYSRMYEQLKFLKHGVGSKAMRSHAEKIIEETTEYFKDFGESGEIDLYQTMSELIINTASRCLLGNEIRGEVHGRVGKLYQQLSDGMKHISFLFPNLPTEFHRQRDTARVEMIKIFSAGIAKRKEKIANGMEKPDDLLQNLIDARYRDGSRPDTEEICGLLIAMLFAGQHTSNITATWVGLRILGAWEKVGDEILTEQKNVLEESKGVVNFEALENMDYLHNCVKETLRLYPPLIILMRKVVIPLKFKKYIVPKGDIICAVPPVGNKLENTYTNPEEFDPDRFTRKEGSEPNAYISFGGGRHQCLGQNFGLLQIKTIWSTLLRQFDFEQIDPLPPIDYSSIVAGFPHPIKTRVRFKRKKNPIGGRL